ncbi:MAG: ankyrin repeat domain-containing protein [Vulcanimicrobiota bacterium]
MSKKWLALTLLVVVNLWLFGAVFWSTWAYPIGYLGRVGAGMVYLALLGVLVLGPIVLVRRFKKGDVFVVLGLVNGLALALLVWRQPVWTRLGEHGLALPRALFSTAQPGPGPSVASPTPTPANSPETPVETSPTPSTLSTPSTPSPEPEPSGEAEVSRFLPTLDSKWERVFAPELPSMQFEYDARNIGAGDELEIGWNGPDGQGSHPVPSKSGNDLHARVPAPSGGWTPGRYQFEMVVNGKSQQQLTMWFYATQKSAELSELFEALYQGDGQKALELLLRHPELAQMRGRDPELDHLEKSHSQADIKAHRLDKLTSVSVEGQTIWPDGGTTALHLALTRAPEVTRRLLELKAPLDIPDHKGFLPTHRAVLADRADLLVRLLEAGAELEGREGTQSLTPLQLAVRQRKGAKCVRVLLERGADPNLTYDLRSPLQDACAVDNVEVARLLLEHGLTAPPSLFLVKGREMAGLFLSHGADLEERNQKGQTPLIAACWAGYDEVVEKLVQAGADVNANDRQGFTPLYGALTSCRAETVKVLLEYGARPEATNSDGKTPEQYLRSTMTGPGTGEQDQQRRQENLEALTSAQP